MSKPMEMIKLRSPEAVGFLFSLYHTLDVGGPAEHDLSDFGDAVAIGSASVIPEYDFYANGVKIEQFGLTWKPASERKQR